VGTFWRIKAQLINQSINQSIGTNKKEQLPTRGVSHCGLAICIKKYLKAKEEL
jgi:hypothetical protein